MVKQYLILLWDPDVKFGISHNIIKSYDLAKIFGAKNFGIHMMTGSLHVMNNDYWKQSINILIDNIINIQNTLDIEIKYINIGGGIGTYMLMKTK